MNFMKKTFLLTLLYFCFNSMSAQIPNSLNGRYVFEQAELTIVNYSTKEVVEQQKITDIAAIDIHNMHLENLFLKLDLTDGDILECVLLDNQQYRLNDMQKFESANYKQGETSKLADADKDYLFAGKELPLYSLKEEGEKLIISFPPYNFGQSDINFTMQAELVLTMTKQTNK